ncbi:MAG: hypothetical protein IPH22_12255 [Nitrosomonas sp.]|nr:hypothetical protein [Nitrosomonas sp.]
MAKIKRIALDEIYQGKKLGYLTIVLDLQRGAVILLAMERCRCTDSVLEAFETIGARIEAVATDMGPAYSVRCGLISQMQR